MTADTTRPEAGPLLTGAQALTQRLKARGFKWAFAYPGTSETYLCSVLHQEPAIRLVPAWGDKEAAFMAAGANLLRIPIAFSVLHGARGLTNALGAIADSRRSEIPVLHVVGMASRQSQPYLPPHAEPDLIPTAGRFASYTVDCSEFIGFKPEEFLAAVNSAIDAVRCGVSGPVLLGIPQDLLEESFVPADMLDVTRPVLRKAGQAVDVTRAAHLLAASANPVVVVDDYLLTGHEAAAAQAALGAVAGSIGAPVFQVAYRRGPMLYQAIDRNVVPTFAGHYDPENPAHRSHLASSDLLVTVEDRNMYPRVIGRLPSCRKIAITSNGQMTRKNGYLSLRDLVLDGPVADTLWRVRDRLPFKHTAVLDIPKPTPAGCVASQSLVGAIADILRTVDRPCIVDDSQSLGGLLARNIEQLPSNTKIFGSHSGFVGSGFPIASGLAIANGDMVVCLLGDHGYLNAIQALLAISAESVPMLVLACNNGGSHSLSQETPSLRGVSVVNEHPSASYPAIAAAFGIDSRTIDWPTCDKDPVDHRDSRAEIRQCGERVLRLGQPLFIEIRVPQSDQDFWAGVWRVSGNELEGVDGSYRTSPGGPPIASP